MSRKQESVTVSMLPEHKEALEKLALEFGMVFGEKPSISKLLRAITDKEITHMGLVD